MDVLYHSTYHIFHETGSWGVKDTLSDIVYEIYDKLNDIIHPNPRPGLDYEEVRYYSEVEYIDEEEQKYREENYNLDFKKDEWRA